MQRFAGISAPTEWHAVFEMQRLLLAAQ